ncbi:uncharacterized protein LOC144743115 [Ciona intestinalis]
MKINMHTIIYSSNFDDIVSSLNNLEACQQCNKTFCASELFIKHFKAHYLHGVKHMLNGKEVITLPCRKHCITRKSAKESQRSHYHCPLCKRVIGRKATFSDHLLSCKKVAKIGILARSILYCGFSYA